MENKRAVYNMSRSIVSDSQYAYPVVVDLLKIQWWSELLGDSCVPQVELTVQFFTNRGYRIKLVDRKLFWCHK